MNRRVTKHTGYIPNDLFGSKNQRNNNQYTAGACSVHAVYNIYCYRTLAKNYFVVLINYILLLYIDRLLPLKAELHSVILLKNIR